MRILIANKFWYHRGGLERVMFDEIAWLEDAGHLVAHFSTKHPLNESSPWADYFAPYVELGESGDLGTAQKLTAAARIFYNREAAKRFTRLLLDFRPDVIHVHGIHRQISASILIAAQARRVPVVQTMHDGHAFCCGDVLLRGNGEVCSPALCRLSAPWAGVRNRCVRGRLGQSGLATAELFFRNSVLRYQFLVRRFVSPSRFLAAQLVAAGLTKRPIDVIPNAVALEPPGQGGANFLFAGRLAHEKGLPLLLEAANRAGVALTIAGDGPLASLARTHSSTSVLWLGHVSPARVTELLRHAAAAVVPSICFENAPLSVLEPMASGVPVVASRVGAIPELLRDHEDGLLVEPASVSCLADALRTICSDVGQARRMGASARERAGRLFAPDGHLESLLSTYALATGRAA